MMNTCNASPSTCFKLLDCAVAPSSQAMIPRPSERDNTPTGKKCIAEGCGNWIHDLCCSEEAGRTQFCHMHGPSSNQISTLPCSLLQEVEMVVSGGAVSSSSKRKEQGVRSNNNSAKRRRNMRDENLPLEDSMRPEKMDAVWNYFRFYANGKKPEHIVCRVVINGVRCNREIKHSKSTGSLRKHLQTHADFWSRLQRGEANPNEEEEKASGEAALQQTSTMQFMGPSSRDAVGPVQEEVGMVVSAGAVSSSSKRNERGERRNMRDENLPLEDSVRPGKMDAVWNYFRFYANGKKPEHVVCQVMINGLPCNREIKHSKSTGSLRKHLRTHADFWSRLQRGEANPNEEGEAKASGEALPQHTSTKQLMGPSGWDAVLRHILEDSLPFCLVDSPSFGNMLQAAQNCAAKDRSWDMSSDTVTLYLTDKCVQMEKRVRETLKGQFVSLTTEAWTSVSAEGFVAITAHFVDEDMKMRQVSLGCNPKAERHTANNQEQHLMDKLRYFNVKVEHVVQLTTDAAANNMAMDVPFDHKRCIIDALQNITLVVLSDDEVKNVIAAGRDLVAHFRHSFIATSQLDKIQLARTGKTNALVQDVATRWWTTMHFLERLVELRPDIMEWSETLAGRNCFVMQDFRRLRPWSMYELLLELLKPFREAHKAVKEEKYVAISTVPAVVKKLRYELREKCAFLAAAKARVQSSANGAQSINIPGDEEKSRLSSAVDSMVKEFDATFGDLKDQAERWTCYLSKMGLLASMCDVRTKHWSKGPEMYDTEASKATLLDFLRKELEVEALRTYSREEAKIKAQYKARDTAAQGEVIISGEGEEKEHPLHRFLGETEPATAPAATEDVVKGMEEEMNRRLEARKNELLTSVELEVTDYLEEPRLQCTTDPLAWWRLKRERYPLLYQVARKVLCIQASSAACEGEFSGASGVGTNDRNRLASSNLGISVFLRRNMNFLGF
ncbi:unnamed protein product [Chrysoparadoxa australica]